MPPPIHPLHLLLRKDEAVLASVAGDPKKK